MAQINFRHDHSIQFVFGHVEKKEGEVCVCVCVCVFCDLRQLNDVTIKPVTLKLRVDENLPHIDNIKCSPSLDLVYACWQKPLKTKVFPFTGEIKLFQWKCIHFGQHNTTATFRRAMSTTQL